MAIDLLDAPDVSLRQPLQPNEHTKLWEKILSHQADLAMRPLPVCDDGEVAAEFLTADGDKVRVVIKRTVVTADEYRLGGIVVSTQQKIVVAYARANQNWELRRHDR